MRVDTNPEGHKPVPRKSILHIPQLVPFLAIATASSNDFFSKTTVLADFIFFSP